MKKSISIALAWLGFIIGHAQTTFNYTGGLQTYVVPAGVTSIQIDCIGGRGGYHYAPSAYPQYPGNGGRVEAVLAVTPGSTLNIYVGGVGESSTSSYMAAGGYNGGAGGGMGFSTYCGGGGGGASDIRIGGTALTDRVVVAGGGGGGAVNYSSGDNGGNGGDLIGADGESGGGPSMGHHGGGGSQVAGGAGGFHSGYVPASAGTLGAGGAGGVDGAGGGGGGGYYGGGGGAWAGGGGGSSYIDAVLCSGTVHTQGFNSTGNGSIIITELCVGLTTSVSATSVCEGETVTLSASSTGSGTVTWDGGVVDGVPFTPAVGTTTFTATSTDPGDCLFSVDITVNPLPTIGAGSDVSACEGETVTLSGTGADTYAWDGGVADGVAFTPPGGTTTYTVTGTITATGCENSDAVDVTYTMVDEGVTVTGGTLSSDQAGATYQWIDCSTLTPVAGETGQDFTPTQNGDYAVVVTIGGCSDTSLCETISGIGFDENTASGWEIYPNPAKDEFTIEFSGAFSFELRSVNGAFILSGQAVDTKSIDAAMLNNGIYILRLNQESSCEIREIIIAR